MGTPEVFLYKMEKTMGTPVDKNVRIALGNEKPDGLLELTPEQRVALLRELLRKITNFSHEDLSKYLVYKTVTEHYADPSTSKQAVLDGSIAKVRVAALTEAFSFISLEASSVVRWGNFPAVVHKTQVAVRFFMTRALRLLVVAEVYNGSDEGTTLGFHWLSDEELVVLHAANPSLLMTLVKSLRSSLIGKPRRVYRQRSESLEMLDEVFAKSENILHLLLQ